MKEHAIRTAAACLLGALSLAGCDAIAPESPRPMMAPATVYHNTPAFKAGGAAASVAAKPTELPPVSEHSANPVVVSTTRPAVSAEPDLEASAVATTEPHAPPRPMGHQASPGHAEDYGWLVGEVQRYHRVAKGWRLRYTRVDEEDVYGGSVLLVSDGDHLDKLEEGQTIRVKGRLLNPDSRSAGTPYQVESLQVVGK